MTPEVFQTKFQWIVQFTMGDGTTLSFDSPSELTTPETSRNTVTRFNNKLNQEVHLQGRPSYGEFTVRGAMEVKTGGNTKIAQALAQLVDMPNNLLDKVDVLVMMQDHNGGLSYVKEYLACSLVGIKFDDLNRITGDDNVFHVALTFKPSRVKNLSGPQSA